MTPYLTPIGTVFQLGRKAKTLTSDSTDLPIGRMHCVGEGNQADVDDFEPNVWVAFVYTDEQLTEWIP